MDEECNDDVVVVGGDDDDGWKQMGGTGSTTLPVLIELSIDVSELVNR